MSLQRNYYEVLGITPSATTDQIKKKYRELARKFHPDITPDKVLGQRVFTQINQAYRVLADPERRAQYNSQLAALAAPTPGTGSGSGSGSGTGNGSKVAPAPPPVSPSRPVVTPSQARPAQTPPATQTRPAQPPPAQTPPAASAPRATPQTARPQSGSAAQPRPAAPQGQPGTAQKAQAITGLLANADNAIMAGKPVEARAFCVKALEIDPRSVRALEIMGDALVQMGQREEAAVQYRNALQITPSSLIQAKLNRLEQALPPTRTNPPSGEGDKPGGGLFGRFLGRK